MPKAEDVSSLSDARITKQIWICKFNIHEGDYEIVSQRLKFIYERNNAKRTSARPELHREEPHIGIYQTYLLPHYAKSVNDRSLCLNVRLCQST